MRKHTSMDEVLAGEWFAVLQSGDVTDRPVQVIVMNERVVVFRTRIGVHAFKDLCVHRGSALSIGSVQNDTLVCPYHGWQFDGKGNCVCIPAQPVGVAIPLKAKAQVYSCEEKYGFIWLCIGEPSAPIPEIAYFNDPHYATHRFGPYRLHASSPRVIENFLDYSHLMWVHEGYLSHPDYAEIPGYKVHRREGRLVTDEVVVQEYAFGDPERRMNPVVYVKEACRPLIAFLKKTMPSGKVLCIMMMSYPVDEETSITYTIHAINFDPGDLTAYRRVNDEVMAQDALILENQKPEELPLDLQAELSLKSDMMSIAYRKWLSELGIRWGTA